MQFLKRTALVILLLLVLTFLKQYVDHSGTVYRDYARNLIANIQLLLLTGLVVTGLIQFMAEKIMRRQFSLWKAVVAFLLLLGLAEAGTYYFLKHPGYLPLAALDPCREYYGNYGRQQAEFDPHCARYDSVLTYTLLTDTAFHFNNYEFETAYSTNSLGLRDDSISLVKPSIICLGDSYTMGWGVQQQETFPALIEQQTGLKVLNAGVASYGTARELLSLERMDLSALQYIIIQYCANDVTENNTFLGNNYHLPVMPRHKYDSLTSALQNRLQYYPFKHVLTTTRLWAQQVFRKPGKPYSINTPEMVSQSFQQQAENFWTIIHQKLSHLPPLKLIVFDVSGMVKVEKRFIEALRTEVQLKDSLSLLKKASIVDIAPYLKKEDFFLLDGHLNAHGHATLAKLLANEIRH